MVQNDVEAAAYREPVEEEVQRFEPAEPGEPALLDERDKIGVEREEPEQGLRHERPIVDHLDLVAEQPKL